MHGGRIVKGIAHSKCSGRAASACALNYKHCGVHLGTLGSCQPDKNHSRICWQGASPQQHEEGFLLCPGSQNGAGAAPGVRVSVQGLWQRLQGHHPCPSHTVTAHAYFMANNGILLSIPLPDFFPPRYVFRLNKCKSLGSLQLQGKELSW